MRTVNDIALGSPRERNPKEQEKFLTAFANTLKGDDYEALRNVQHEFCSVYGKSYGIIPRFGEASFNEMLGCLAIWCTQFGAETFDAIMELRKRRKKFEPTWKGTPTC